MKIIRTNKEISKENLSEEFVRKAASIGGKHRIPLVSDIDEFTVTNNYINVSDDGRGSISPYNGYVSGYHKVLDSVEIRIKGFDMITVIWQNGIIQGYYVSKNMQYAANPIEWVNLLLEYGFLKVLDNEKS